MNDTERTYQKYLEAVEAVTAGGQWIDPGVLRLALRLAVADAYAAGASQATTIPARYQRQAETNEAQIAALNAWLSEHEYALYASSADTADAILAAIGRRDRDMQQLHEQLAQLDADNTGLHRELAIAQERAAIAEQINGEVTDLHYWMQNNLPVQYDAWLHGSGDSGVVAFAETLLDGQMETIRSLQANIARMEEYSATHEMNMAEYLADKDKLLRWLEANYPGRFAAWVENDDTIVDTFLGIVDDLRARLADAYAVQAAGERAAALDATLPAVCPAPPTNGNGATPGIDWSALEQADREWLESLEKGRRSWRSVPAETRRALAAAMLAQFLATAANRTQAEFDALRPHWMPEATALTRMSGRSWADLMDRGEL